MVKNDQSCILDVGDLHRFVQDRSEDVNVETLDLDLSPPHMDMDASNNVLLDDWLIDDISTDHAPNRYRT